MADANVTGPITDAIDISTENHVGLFVFAATGAHDNHVVGLEVSHNGTDWAPVPQRLTGVGYLYYELCAQKIRAKVYKAEGATSTVTVGLFTN